MICLKKRLLSVMFQAKKKLHLSSWPGGSDALSSAELDWQVFQLHQLWVLVCRPLCFQAAQTMWIFCQLKHEAGCFSKSAAPQEHIACWSVSTVASTQCKGALRSWELYTKWRCSPWCRGRSSSPWLGLCSSPQCWGRVPVCTASGWAPQNHCTSSKKPARTPLQSPS